MFIRSPDQKKTISERAKLIKQENFSILWSNLLNFDISLLSFSTVTPLFYWEIRTSALEETTLQSWSGIWIQELILMVNLKRGGVQAISRHRDIL